MLDQQHRAEGGVLMVGSVPLKDTKTVFTRLSTLLAGRLRSLPDGETGERYHFCRWQYHSFPLEVLTNRPDLPQSNQAPRDRYTIDDINGTGYDDAALASYADFQELRKQGVVSDGVRFQVCIPTPFGVVLNLCKTELRPQIEPLYEERFIQAIRRIVDGIPRNDLLIQWDLPFETLVLEYDRGTFTLPRFKVWFEPVLEGVIERLIRVNQAVPSDVPIGFHLCYGDIAHKHYCEPKDTSLMVKLAHSLTEACGSTHQIEYIHMPVPIERTDVEYFKPLEDLNLQGHTRLCLGLVHANDEAGTQKRIKVAKSVYPRPFAVATECGLGRTPLEDIDSIFQILEQVSDPIID